MRIAPTQPSDFSLKTTATRRTTPNDPQPSRGWWLSFLWVVCCFALGGWCILPSSSDPTASARTASTGAPHEYITKPIGEIRKGDIVLARDEFGKNLGLKRVVEVYRRTSDHLRILTFAAPDGSEQTLKTTDDHPFWVVSRDAFVDAKRLQPGDQFASPHGPRQRLIRSIYQPHPEGVPVYNFQVEDYHTYFVGDQAAVRPLPILVHNSQYGPEGEVPTINGRKPINSAYAGKTHPSGVRFNERGFPDFDPYAKAKVELDGLTGNYAKGAALANKAVRLNNTPSDYVRHHVENGRTMQLIPKDIHSAARHIGGSALIRNGGLD